MPDHAGPAGEQEGLFAAPAASARPDEPARTGRPRTTAGFALAPQDPVALVRLIGVLPHLDRPFEYAVTEEAAAAGPGMRVKVRFSGRETDGIVLGRRPHPSTDRPLAPIRKLVSEDVVLPPALLRVCEEVAERCAGTVGDVLRLALPPRHARAERAERAAIEKAAGETPDDATTDAADPADEGAADPGTVDLPASITRYRGLPALLERAGTEGPVPRAAVVLEPVDAWTELAAAAVAAVTAADPQRGALVVAPDQRDVARASAALTARGIAHEVLGSGDGPEKRYRAFLRILHGRSRVVVGSRSAAFAPIRDLALMILWDGDDDLLDEPRAPYPHTRTVLQCRSHEERASLLLLSASLGVTTTALADSGYLRLLEPAPAPVTTLRPRVVAMDEHLREREGPSGRSRIPREALRVIRRGLDRGPVLVQVPRSGYVPVLACTFCGTRCLCPTCSATLQVARGGRGLACGVCGRREDAYRCPECDRREIRAVVVGSARTAEELRRALPDAPFRVAGGAHGAVGDDDVPPGAVVVSTPGAEPVPPDGYAAAVLLDADAMLARAAFDADVEAIRRWQNAIALVRTGEHGGEVLVVGTATLPAIRDLVAHRSRVFLDRVLEDRRTLDLPPFTRAAEIVGDREACRTFLDLVDLPDATDVFGPVDLPPTEGRDLSRAVLRIDPARVRDLADVLRAGVATRTARKLPGSLRVRLDPPDVF